jgi:hypothetical protein
MRKRGNYRHSGHAPGCQRRTIGIEAELLFWNDGDGDMKKQLIHCIGWSEGQLTEFSESFGKILMLVSGPRGGIIAYVQFDKTEFCSLIQDLQKELSENPQSA